MSATHPLLDSLHRAEKARDQMIAKADADHDAAVKRILAEYTTEIVRLVGPAAPDQPAAPAIAQVPEADPAVETKAAPVEPSPDVDAEVYDRPAHPGVTVPANASEAGDPWPEDDPPAPVAAPGKKAAAKKAVVAHVAADNGGLF